MWRAYDGLSPVTQTEIFEAVGGAPCDLYDAADGARMFTSSGSDAYPDVVSPSQGEDFLARQLTSIDRAVPVIVIVNPWRDHVVIVNGGSYGYNSMDDDYTWSTVVFHDPDPFVGSNQELNSNEWIEYTCHDTFSHCGQVVSNGASYNWASHTSVYRPQVKLYDGGATCCNEENRY